MPEKRNRMIIRAAEDKDFARMYGLMPPDNWEGYVAVRNNLVIGIAGIMRNGDTVWGFLDAAPGVKSPVVLHRRALRFLSEIKETVKVVCDTRFASAEKWLLRLGFVKTEEEYGGMNVWVRNG